MSVATGAYRSAQGRDFCEAARRRARGGDVCSGRTLASALGQVFPWRGTNVVSAKLAALRPLLSLVLATWFGAASVCQ
jgi:hypothetical protein